MLSGSSLSPAAAEFVPRQPAAGMEQMQQATAHESDAAARRVARREIELGKELRLARKATREAVEAAEAAKAAKHNAEALLRAPSRLSGPLGIKPRSRAPG